MDQLPDSIMNTGLQEQMTSLQQLVKQQAEQLNLLQQWTNAANISPQPQSESQSAAQPAATHPCLILPDSDIFDGNDHALYSEFKNKLASSKGLKS